MVFQKKTYLQKPSNLLHSISCTEAGLLALNLRCKPFVGHWPWYQRCWSVWSLKVWCPFCCVFFCVSSLFLVGAGKGEVVDFVWILKNKQFGCLVFVGSLQVPLWWWKPSIPIMSWHWKRWDTSDFLCVVFPSDGREGWWFCLESDEKLPPYLEGSSNFCWSGFDGDMSMVWFCGKKGWIIWSQGEIHKRFSISATFRGWKPPISHRWASGPMTFRPISGDTENFCTPEN